MTAQQKLNSVAAYASLGFLMGCAVGAATQFGWLGTFLLGAFTALICAALRTCRFAMEAREARWWDNWPFEDER